MFAWTAAAHRAASPRRRAGPGWRAAVALLAAVALVVLATASQAHQHAGAAMADACVICTAAASNIGTGNAPPALAAPAPAIAYIIHGISAAGAAAPPARLPPNICGPPCAA